MIPMGKIKRELNTNERLENALKMFNDIESCIQDILAEPEGIKGKAMTTICREHGIDYLNLRKVLSLSSFQNIYIDKVITADEIELPEMDPWEKLFRAVFGINKSEPIELPVDIKESIQYTMDQCLTDREKKVLNVRFGLIEEFDGDPTPMILEDVGEKMSVTRNRIRQIEAKAIRKLRHPSRAKILRDGLTKFKETEAVKLAEIEMEKAEAKKRVEEFKKQLEERRQNVDGMSELVEVLKKDKLDALNLPVRAYNALIRTRKIKTVYDVVTTPDSELVRIRNLGRCSYHILKTALNDYLNEFGVTLSDVRTSLGVKIEDSEIYDELLMK